MPMSTKTFLETMMAEVSKGYKTEQELFKNYDKLSKERVITWVVIYGDGFVYFQYVDECNVNVVFINPYNLNNPFEVIAFYEDEPKKMSKHLTTIREYMDVLFYEGCPHDKLLEVTLEYAKKV